MSNGEEVHILEIHKPGVYAIHNKRNGKYYIGSTNDLCNRTKTHRQNLYNGRINSRMAQDLASGKRQKDFEFIALKVFENGEVTESYLRNQEAYFIKKYKADSDGYNDPSHAPMPHPKNGNNFVFAPQEFDRVAVNLPKGTKEKIKELTGKSCNAYISELVINDLEKLEKPN